MKDYIVKFIGAKGNANNRSFDSYEKAKKFATNCGDYIISKYNPETFEYDVIETNI